MGEELAVQAVLAGGFLKAPDRFRVTAQLIATETGEILWSDKIDTPQGDLMSLQDLIAARVVAGLKVRLSAEEQAQIAKPATRDPQAHEFYLRGRDLLFRYTLHTLRRGDLEEAIRMFNEAVGLDPDFARAHTALGRCYVQHAQGYGGPEYFVLAERAAEARARARPHPRRRAPADGLRRPPPRRQGAARTRRSRRCWRRRATIPRCCSWRACSTAWTASTSRRSPSTTACWS